MNKSKSQKNIIFSESKKENVEILDFEEKTIYEKKHLKKHRVIFIIIFMFLFFIFVFSLKTTSIGKSITSFSKKLFDGTLVYTQVIPKVEIDSNGYSNNVSGSWHIDKFAEWTGADTAKVTFDLNTFRKLKASQKYQDIILVMDVSGSMYGSKLLKAVSDAKELVSSVLNDSHNRVALISFHSTSSVISSFTNDKDQILQLLNSLTTQGCTNYYRGLMDVNTVMENYQKESNRTLTTLFLTDGYPNEEAPNQIGAYALLKDKYPYMTINGIQYEMGNNIVKQIKEISDNQFIANRDTLNNVLFEGLEVVSPLYYKEFIIKDYIHNDYFTISSVDDIKVDKGKVSLTEENGVPKITWNLENSITGFNAKMEINLKLKEQYVGQDGFYPTNKKEEIVSKIEEQEMVTTTLTPVLKNAYKVHYDTNTPVGCSILNPNSESYAIYQNVKIKQENLKCNGWNFEGWKIQDSDDIDVIHINNDIFQMPEHDVVIRGTWSKHMIWKTMNGKVHENSNFLIQQFEDSLITFGKNISRDSFESITTLNEISIPNDVIDSWDASEQQNESVMAWYTDRDNNGKYELYLGQDGGVKANPNSSYTFYAFDYLFSIDLTHFDTSNVTNMSYMFFWTECLRTLDLGSNFDTSKVMNMSYMFYGTGCGSPFFTLDLGDKFDTSNVTDMSYMFYEAGYRSRVFTLDLGSKFDTSKVTDMSYMFYRLNYYMAQNLTFTLNLGDKFDTSNVTNMESMFESTGTVNPNFTLDLGSKFDTSNVTNMCRMFYETGSSSTIFTLDLGDKFDTSNVLVMQEMFSNTGFSSTVFTLDLGNKFDTSNVTNMHGMFCYTGYENQNFALDLGDKFVFSNVSCLGMFDNWRTTNKLYVKSIIEQNWIINNSGNSNLTIANVLIRPTS